MENQQVTPKCSECTTDSTFLSSVSSAQSSQWSQDDAVNYKRQYDESLGLAISSSITISRARMANSPFHLCRNVVIHAQSPPWSGHVTSIT